MQSKYEDRIAYAIVRVCQMLNAKDNLTVLVTVPLLHCKKHNADQEEVIEVIIHNDDQNQAVQNELSLIQHENEKAEF